MTETSTEKELKVVIAAAHESIAAGSADEYIHDRPELKIDRELKFLIPDLSQEASDQLEKNILRDGCIDPIVIWAGHDTILDGHNRYRICKKMISISKSIHWILLPERMPSTGSSITSWADAI